MLPKEGTAAFPSLAGDITIIQKGPTTDLATNAFKPPIRGGGGGGR